MLRKRTSFKPNLKPTASQPTVNPQSQPDGVTSSQNNTTTKDASDQQHASPGQRAEIVITDDGQPRPLAINTNNTTIAINDRPPNEAQEVGSDLNVASENSLAHSPLTTQRSEPQISSERVQEAISQLTCQKFEPIKSLSLRSSANKNVKLKDLLFFNPPMTKDQKRHKKSISQAKKSDPDKPKSAAAASSQTCTPQPADESSQTADGASQASQPDLSLVPKVKMGPEGKLVLDESSTIINRKNLIKDQEAIVEDNEDVISRTNYDSFRRKPTTSSQTKWSLEDTNKFYHALTVLGTDFSMMESLLFSGLRSRTELHKKFKREERVNKRKIDIALDSRISLNSEELNDLKEIFNK